MAAAIVEELLQHLAAQLSVLDKVVRWRSCQLLQQLLSGLPSQFLLDVSVAGVLRGQLAERLQDKLVAVRAEAAKCVSYLVEDDQVSVNSNSPSCSRICGLACEQLFASYHP